MVKVLRTRKGYVKAFLEYVVLDQDGNINDNGKYLYINDMWIHKKHRRQKLMKILISELFQKFYGKIETIYWVRHKYDERMTKFHISRFQKYYEEVTNGKQAAISAATA